MTAETELTPFNGQYQQLMQSIGACLASGQQTASKHVNRVLVETYWQIGQYIIEFEQQGHQKADYGAELLKRLSKDLKTKHGKGFSRRNLLDMRRFYLKYPIWQTLSAKLSWSHYTEFLSISDDLATDKDEVMVEYATGSISNQLFVSRYQLYLPDVELLKRELQRLLENKDDVF